MFSKSFIIFGLLALFACQGTTATQLTEVERASLADLIKQVKEIISGLNNIVSGVLGDALKVLGNLAGTILQIKEKFLNEGLNAITGGVGDVIEFIANKTAEAAALGIDITKCILGTNETLAGIVTDLTGKLTNCVTDTASIVLNTVNEEIDNLNDIVKTIVAAPLKLSKCLISLRPISCVTKLLGDLTTMLKTLPGQIKQVVDTALSLVDSLPSQLVKCVEDITTTVHTKTEALIEEIGSCVDDLISQSTTAAATDATTAAATDATTAAATEATTAAATEATTAAVPALARASLGELIDQVKNIISSLNNLVSGVVGDALGTIGSLIATVNELKEKYLDQGIALITDTVGNVASFIKNKTEEAAQLGIDITKCVVGTNDQVQELTTGLVANLTDCITTTVVQVLTMVNQDIENVNNIVQEVTGAPVKLAKCLVTLRPISCVTDLLKNLTNLLTTIPAQVQQIVEHAMELVQTLPGQLTGCLSDIGESATAQTNQIIADVGKCVDDIISGSA